MIFVVLILLISNTNSPVLLILGPLLIFGKFARVIYALLALEFLSLLILIWTMVGGPLSSISVSGLLLILSCLILEASTGIGLLVSLLRWGGKPQMVSL